MKFVRRGENPASREQIEKMAEHLGISPVLCELLLMRGIDEASAPAFFSPGKEQLNNPYAFANMQKTVERIRRAAETGESVCVYGDYDSDGVNGAAILTKTFAMSGIQNKTYIPERMTEGYGLNMEAVERIAGEGTTLLVLVDCGITNVVETALAREKGMDVVILDHHEPGETLPDTPYLMDAKIPGETYPFAFLCGAGVAFTLARALIGERAMELIDLAAVATIGDIVPLVGENRAIAALGMEKLRKNPCVGLDALIRCARVKQEKLTSGTVAFTIVPRLNAAGRLASPKIAARLLAAGDRQTAMQAAQELERINEERQTLQSRLVEKAAAQVRQTVRLCDTRMIFLYDPEFHPGVAGLVASALVKEFYRPVAVFAKTSGGLTGSARSVPGVNLYEALCSAKDLFLKFGGHEQAAGLTLSEENFAPASARINAYLKEHYPDSLWVRREIYDLPITGKDVTNALLYDLSRMEPFGQENPAPVFAMQGVSVEDERKIGGGKHVKFTLDGVNAVQFGTSGGYSGGVYTALGELSRNDFDGKPQMIVRRMEPAGPDAAEQAAKANEREYLRAFPRELAAYHAFLKNPTRFAPETDGDAFFAALRADAAASPLGTLCAVNSQPGADALFLHDLPALETAKNGIPEDSAENALCLCAKNAAQAGNYRNLYLCGAFSLLRPGARVLFTDGLRAAYRKEAQAFCLDERALVLVYRAIEETLAKTPMYGDMGAFFQAVQLTAPEYTEKQLWFAMQVFGEEKLISVKKGDKILLKCIKTSKALTLALGGHYARFWEIAERK